MFRLACVIEALSDDNVRCRDVTYMAASGSVIGAAGYSSNGVNVVIWDTLAPPTTSQASLMCHEGIFSSLCYVQSKYVC